MKRFDMNLFLKLIYCIKINQPETNALYTNILFLNNFFKKMRFHTIVLLFSVFTRFYIRLINAQKHAFFHMYFHHLYA